MKQTRKTNLFKKLDIAVMEKCLYFIYPFPIALCFVLHIQFRLGQESVKCYKIAALNKNSMISLSSISLYRHNIFNFYFIHLKYNNR